jgi:tetratricopeptide (TPR) repeat protein
VKPDEQRGAERPPEAIPPGEISALLEELARAPEGLGASWERWLRPGAVVGRFELVREIGRGGFGVVWEARDRDLGRAVAFKAVRSGERAGVREERLLREAEAAARLSHPNVVTLHEAGHCEHGPYLVLELLRGQTLAERLDQGPMPVREAVRIGTEVARALAHAHGEGVVHRDLKPANVFVCADGQVKVLDFGLAHAFGRRRAAGGTPAYMAPEQARGAPEDERTDVFALGVVMYRMLAGSLPFLDGGRSLTGPRRAVRLAVEEVPALGDLVARMLAKDPVDRPRDGGEVLAALEAFRQEMERTPSSASRVVRSHHPALRLAAVAGIGLAIVAGVGVAAWLLARRAGEPAAGAAAPGPASAPAASGRMIVAVADIANDTGEKDLDILSRLLATSLEQSRKLLVIPRSRLQDLVRPTGSRYAERIDEPEARAAARRAGAGTLLLPAVHRIGSTYVVEVRVTDPSADQPLFTAKEQVASKDALVSAIERISDKTRREMGEAAADVETARVQLGQALTRSLEAYQHWQRGVDIMTQYAELAAAAREYRRALETDPEFAPAHLELAYVAHHYGRPAEAEAHARAGAAGLERLPDRERLLYQRVDLDDPADVTRYADEVLARFPTDKLLLFGAAQALYLSRRHPDRAEGLYRKALELDPGVYCATSDLLMLLADEGRTSDAVAVARRTVAARPTAANTALLAFALANDGILAEASTWAREALRRNAGASIFVTLFAGEVLVRGSQFEEAEGEFRRLASRGESPEERGRGYALLVGLLGHEGRRRESLAALAEAGSLYPPKLTSSSPSAFVTGVGQHRLAAPDALAAVRRATPDPMQPAMLAFHGDLAGAASAASTLGKGSFAERYHRALAAAHARRWDEAIPELRALFAEAPHVSSRMQFVYLLGEALLEAGRPADAVDALRPAIGAGLQYASPVDLAANYPRALLVRARAYEQLGKKPEALAEVDRLLDLWKRADPDLPLLAEAKGMRARLAAP